MDDATMVRIGLWIHILAAGGVLAGIATELIAGHLLARARDVAEVRPLASFAEHGGRVTGLGLLALLLSGPDLSSRMGFFEGAGVQGWIAVAIVVVVVVGGVGGMLHRRAFRRARALAGDGVGPVTAELRAHLARPAPWTSMHAVLGAVAGTIWIMSNKPLGVVDALVPVVVGTVAGLVAGLVVARLTATRLAA